MIGEVLGQFHRVSTHHHDDELKKFDHMSNDENDCIEMRTMSPICSISP